MYSHNKGMDMQSHESRRIILLNQQKVVGQMGVICRMGEYNSKQIILNQMSSLYL